MSTEECERAEGPCCKIFWERGVEVWRGQGQMCPILINLCSMQPGRILHNLGLVRGNIRTQLELTRALYLLELTKANYGYTMVTHKTELLYTLQYVERLFRQG